MGNHMRRTRQRLSAVLALVLGATLAVPDPARGQPASGPEVAAESRAARTASVTLVTGDVVHLATYPDGRQAASVRPGPASGDGDFHALERHGQTYVFPDAALPYLRSGLLEERLFNVTE